MTSNETLARTAGPGVGPQVADHTWRAIHRAACAPYRNDSTLAGRWAWHWARGKLGRDPVFRGLLERGDLPPRARVVDVGCGVGLLASLISACAAVQARGAWPAGWPPAPSALSYHGIELMARDATRGNAALQRLRTADFQPHIVCGDLREAALPACDVVVILDVLHYVDYAAQDALLRRVRETLSTSAGGPRRLLLRVGDAQRVGESSLTNWVDWIVTTARGHSVPTTWVRTLDAWCKTLRELGFGPVQRVPMSQGTPFANVLLIGDLLPEACA